jgi:hypothetical protein
MLSGAPARSGHPAEVTQPVARNASGRQVTTAAAPYSRHSHGLDQFFTSIRDETGLSILDLGEVCQPNVSFITSLGHKLYSEDYLRTLDSAPPADAPPVQSILEQALDFPAEHLDGVLAWDTLQYLPPPLLAATVDRLFEILRPGSYMLAFFHASEKAETVPCYSYRISDARTLLLVPRGYRKPAQFFNNRGIEKLFHRFTSVKFFLTRDHLREIIVKR